MSSPQTAPQCPTQQFLKTPRQEKQNSANGILFFHLLQNTIFTLCTAVTISQEGEQEISKAPKFHPRAVFFPQQTLPSSTASRGSAHILESNKKWLKSRDYSTAKILRPGPHLVAFPHYGRIHRALDFWCWIETELPLQLRRFQSWERKRTSQPRVQWTLSANEWNLTVRLLQSVKAMLSFGNKKKKPCNSAKCREVCKIVEALARNYRAMVSGQLWYLACLVIWWHPNILLAQVEVLPTIQDFRAPWFCRIREFSRAQNSREYGLGDRLPQKGNKPATFGRGGTCALKESRTLSINSATLSPFTQK